MDEQFTFSEETMMAVKRAKEYIEEMRDTNPNFRYAGVRSLSEIVHAIIRFRDETRGDKGVKPLSGGGEDGNHER